MTDDWRVVLRIVEDEPLIALWLKEMIDHEEVDVAVLTSTSDFERLLTPEPWEDVDAAVVDIMLPGVSGIEILTYLRDVHPDIRRIAMTASIPGVDDAMGLADVVLIKPFHGRDLIDALEVDR